MARVGLREVTTVQSRVRVPIHVQLCWAEFPVEFRVTAFYPRFTPAVVIRPHGGYAFTSAPEGWELHPHERQVVQPIGTAPTVCLLILRPTRPGSSKRVALIPPPRTRGSAVRSGCGAYNCTCDSASPSAHRVSVNHVISPCTPRPMATAPARLTACSCSLLCVMQNSVPCASSDRHVRIYEFALPDLEEVNGLAGCRRAATQDDVDFLYLRHLGGKQEG
jgi:hypothetical protein